eukprot:TRINITY_DN5987_c0_g1_i3.p1 TRINITY_DN5987_c0_g1~~TRINITY_DN5987_c0_g1_i3.p1  ORF type:complete len:253 (-),score=29.28 TRINITY_DN5987_c0_g1_i3:373-1131(-)
MTEGTYLAAAPAGSLEARWTDAAGDGGPGAASATERADLIVLRGGSLGSAGSHSNYPGGKGSMGGDRLRRASSQGMGVLSRGICGTPGAGNNGSGWGRSVSAGVETRGGERSGVLFDTARRKQIFEHAASPTSVHAFKDDYVSIDILTREQSMVRNPPIQPKVSSNVLDEFPGLNLKPIRTRTPSNKLPTIHVTKCKPCDSRSEGGQYGVCFGGPVFCMVARLGTAIRACIAALIPCSAGEEASPSFWSGRS